MKPSLIRMSASLLFGVALTLLAPSCLRPADERAQRDLSVGQASAAGLSVNVGEGAAAVRSLESGRLVLWNSVPLYAADLMVGPDAATRWTIELQNALPDSVFSARDESGVELPVSEVPQANRTRKHYELDLPKGRVRLQLSSADQSDDRTWRFALMSDVQEAIDDVQDIYDEMNQDPAIRFLLGAGDLTESGSTEQHEKFQRKLLGLNVPYYTTLGNHELGSDGEVFQSFHGRANFRFVFRGVQFTMIDSGSATLDPLVYDFLETWLPEGRSRVNIVAMHIPPLDPTGVRNGGFASRNEGAKVLTSLARNHVDLTLYGHIHSYYAFDNAGIPAYISGGGGAIPERFDKIGRHFLVIDLDAGAVRSVGIVRVD